MNSGAKSVCKECGDKVRIEKRHKVFCRKIVIEQIVDKCGNPHDQAGYPRSNKLLNRTLYRKERHHEGKNKEKDQVGTHEGHHHSEQNCRHNISGAL